MAEINIYGVLDEQFPQDLRKQLSKIPAAHPVELHISSPGGLLSSGVTAYNILRSSKREVHAYLDGDAFSAATLLVCAADYAEMPSNALMMIHDPWLPMIVPGTITEASTMLKYLKATKKQCLEIYAQSTGMTQRKLSQLMREETYFNAHEAHAAGFVSNVTSASRAIQNRPVDEYSVRDKERLAKMLAKRHVPVDIKNRVSQYGVKMK